MARAQQKTVLCLCMFACCKKNCQQAWNLRKWAATRTHLIQTPTRKNTNAQFQILYHKSLAPHLQLSGPKNGTLKRSLSCKIFPVYPTTMYPKKLELSIWRFPCSSIELKIHLSCMNSYYTKNTAYALFRFFSKGTWLRPKIFQNLSSFKKKKDYMSRFLPVEAKLSIVL